MYKEDDNVLNELISRGDCANCKICCKFEPDELIDAPTFTKKQMQYIKDNINENLKFTKLTMPNKLIYLVFCGCNFPWPETIKFRNLLNRISMRIKQTNSSFSNIVVCVRH